MSNLIDRLVAARTEAGITLPQLARMTNVSVSTLSNIESGRKLPSKSLVALIARYVGANPDWIDHGAPPILLPKTHIGRLFADAASANVALMQALPTIEVSPKKNLPLSANSDIQQADVKEQLPPLLKRLSLYTSERGRKSELAAFIERASKKSAPLSSVSRWLSGEVEPGGEVALLMLKWVELQERKQK